MRASMSCGWSIEALAPQADGAAAGFALEGAVVWALVAAVAAAVALAAAAAAIKPDSELCKRTERERER